MQNVEAGILEVLFIGGIMILLVALRWSSFARVLSFFGLETHPQIRRWLFWIGFTMLVLLGLLLAAG